MPDKNHCHEFHRVLDSIRLTKKERDKLVSAFDSAVNQQVCAAVERGREAGREDARRPEERTRDELRYELLDKVKTALGIDD